MLPSAEAGAPFGESSELAAALEAVLDERVLDERPLDIADVFSHTAHIRNKVGGLTCMCAIVGGSSPRQ